MKNNLQDTINKTQLVYNSSNKKSKRATTKIITGFIRYERVLFNNYKKFGAIK